MKDINDIDFEYMAEYFEELEEWSGDSLCYEAKEALERLAYRKRELSDVETVLASIELFVQNDPEIFAYLEDWDSELLEGIFEDMKGLLE